MWHEVRQAREERRYELTLAGDEINQKIEDNGGLDPGVYELTQLNLLRVSRSPLTSLASDIGQLTNLTNLILQGNKLESLPETMGNLEKLKLLDVSENCLTSLPPGLANLSSLTTLNVNINRISVLPNFEKCVNLAILNVGQNCLTEFPDICHDSLAHLADVMLADNEICGIPSNITVLPSLKVLDVGNNTIKIVPGDLVDCQKLKDLNLKGNPLNDRRFRKLVESDRCLPRQVLDYIRQHCPKTSSEEGKGGSSGKGKKGKGSRGKYKDEEQVDVLCNELHVLSVKDTLPIVQVTAGAREVRPYIVCCVLQGVDLSGENLKKFISVQTKLHEGVCERRMVATIATHDLSKVKGPLKFVARDPDEIRIHPLVRGKEVSARELYEGLQQEAEAQRKHQKRNNVTGLHKFLHIVERWKLWPCFVDTDGIVVSLPPITNAENTKITQETTNVFVEVTSSTSLGKAKEVLDTFVLSSLQMGISPERNAANKTVLTVQQVRVEDENGDLRVIYPSRTDFPFENENVRVLMPSK